jgi:hypothetical protein
MEFNVVSAEYNKLSSPASRHNPPLDGASFGDAS